MICSGASFNRKRGLVALALLTCVSLPFQPLRAVDGLSSPTTAAAQLAPPQPPAAKPPVDFFRSLLAMSPIERREFLATRSSQAQQLILAKLREYEGLKPEERELRLRVTELRWYLLPLLNTPATNRNARLASIPAELRNLVEDRLVEWDKLPANLQNQLLENEATVRLYFELAASTPEERAERLKNTSTTDHEKQEPGIRRWQALTDQQRQTVVTRFNQFFDLTPAEKDKTLRVLSDPERLQIEKTLRTFGSLPAAQRAQCLRSFQRFADLSPAERQQFLQNAERWKLMTPTERQSWRNLVSNLSHQPPLPPGLRPPPNPRPPAPSVPHPGPSSSWATNSN